MGAQVDLYDDRSLARSPKKNWVEKVGGLPPNVRARARAIKRENPSWPMSRCIATAINANKHATATGGDLHFKGKQQEGAKPLARHVAATASWEAKKARAAALRKKKNKKVKLSEAEEVELAEDTEKRPVKKNKRKVKKGTKADVGSSRSKLKKAIKKFKEKNGDPRSAEAARLKSSKQRLGMKGKLNMSERATVDNKSNTCRRDASSDSPLGSRINLAQVAVGATIARQTTFNPAKHRRGMGGKFAPKGTTKVNSASLSGAVNSLAVGESIELPGHKGWIKRVEGGYQVAKGDGTFNKVFKNASDALTKADELVRGRYGKGVAAK